jgi:hypothetical protein
MQSQEHDVTSALLRSYEERIYSTIQSSVSWLVLALDVSSHLRDFLGLSRCSFHCLSPSRRRTLLSAMADALFISCLVALAAMVRDISLNNSALPLVV